MAPPRTASRRAPVPTARQGLTAARRQRYTRVRHVVVRTEVPAPLLTVGAIAIALALTALVPGGSRGGSSPRLHLAAATASVTALPSGTLRALWMTPVFEADLTGELPHGLALRLAQAAIDAHHEFVSHVFASRAASGEVVPPAPDDLNDAFFAWQRERISKEAGDCIEVNDAGEDMHLSQAVRVLCGPDMAELRRHMMAAAIALMRAAGLSDAGLEAQWATISVWAGVHTPGVSHPMHTHAGSMLSGTFYASVPAVRSAVGGACAGSSGGPADGAGVDAVCADGSASGARAGQLVLSDPRGMLPPFGGSYIVTPEPNKVVVFPSWLVHRVTPTVAAGTGDSVAFNELHKSADTSRAGDVGGRPSHVPHAYWASLDNARIAFSWNLPGTWEATTDVNAEFPTEGQRV